MSNRFIQFLESPRHAISITAVVAIVIGAIAYTQIGKPPVLDVSLSSEVASTTISSGNTVALAFPKAGRLETVRVKEGDTVVAGEILATLSAPDALGAVNQTKGALALAQAQFASLHLDYAKTKAQQDLLVENAYQNLLKTPAEAVFQDTIDNQGARNLPQPVITGNYVLGKEGVIAIKTYQGTQGPAFKAAGLDGSVNDSELMSDNPVAIGSTGLFITFPEQDRTSLNFIWEIKIPNTRSAQYAVNKNAYDVAVTTRDKTLSELEANLTDTSGGSVARAQIEAAQGAYDAALGAYQNNVITAPISGVVTFLDDHAKPGQSVVAGKTVVSVTAP